MQPNRKKIKKKKLPPQTSRHKQTKRSAEGFVLIAIKMHWHALHSSLLRLWQTPFNSAMAIAVMAIAIALAGSFYILVSNAQQIVDSLQTGKQVSLFLHERVTEQQAQRLVQRLQKNEQIDAVTLITKQQALAEFQQYSGFGAALDALETNPLPNVIQVLPDNSVAEALQLTQLLAQLQQEREVDFAQMDMDWVARLQAIMQISSSVLVLLSVLLALAVVFITGNTIRLELQARREEVIVQKLVGATNRFISLPFLYSGFWFGLLAGLLAWSIIVLMLLLISTPVEQLSVLYQSHFQLHFLSFTESMLLFFGAAVLGIVGAQAVAYHQLRQLKPE
ncbi:MAG: cell division transport system permease protein [Methyloprofundus sp.]|nr:MAG: cell division transport system permease protein [Methyloprofundus sp.]